MILCLVFCHFVMIYIRESKKIDNLDSEDNLCLMVISLYDSYHSIEVGGQRKKS